MHQDKSSPRLESTNVVSGLEGWEGKETRLGDSETVKYLDLRTWHFWTTATKYIPTTCCTKHQSSRLPRANHTYSFGYRNWPRLTRITYDDVIVGWLCYESSGSLEGEFNRNGKDINT